MTFPINSLPGASVGATPEEEARTAANQLEAFFLRRVLAEVRSSSSGGLMGGGFAGETFQEMLDSALADSMAAGGGLGIADIFVGEFGAQAGVAPGSELAMPSRAHRAYGAIKKSDLGTIPVHGRISSEYGLRESPINGDKNFHTGLDIAAPQGTAVRAAGGGVVVRAEAAGSYGNMVVVDHGDGLETRYAHLSAIDVAVGDKLEPGTVLGAVGSTGRSTGPHLHLEVRQNGKHLDPLEEFSALHNLRERSNR